MFRRDVHGQRVTVACDRMNEALVDAALAQQLLLLCAVLLRPLLEIQIVQNADGLPEIRLVSVAELIRVPAQHIAHDASVFSVKITLVIFAQQLPCLFRGRYHNCILLLVCLCKRETVQVSLRL